MPPTSSARRRSTGPTIGDDDVLVRVHAAGVHIGDWHVMTGQPYLMRVVGFGFRAPKARVRGMDVAGTVEAVGKNVTQFQAGDEVFGTCDGAFAEYASRPQDTLALKPANLTFEQAAAVPTSACRRPPGSARRRQDQARAEGPDRRGVRRRRAVRGADRQIVRRRGDRRVQHGEGRTWSAPSAPTMSSTTPKRTSPEAGSGMT